MFRRTAWRSPDQRPQREPTIAAVFLTVVWGGAVKAPCKGAPGRIDPGASGLRPVPTRSATRQRN
jgi:hypothetical protein